MILMAATCIYYLLLLLLLHVNQALRLEFYYESRNYC
jgi:hypothetical protein